MKKTISEIEWHDARIVELNFLSTQDAFDCLKIKLESEIFLRDYGKEGILLVIKDCYKIRTELNLWITGKASILEAGVYSSSTWITDEKKRFVNGFGPKELLHFIIILNSNSKIEFLLTHNDCVDVEV